MSPFYTENRNQSTTHVCTTNIPNNKFFFWYRVLEHTSRKHFPLDERLLIMYSYMRTTVPRTREMPIISHDSLVAAFAYFVIYVWRPGFRHPQTANSVTYTSKLKAKKHQPKTDVWIILSEIYMRVARALKHTNSACREGENVWTNDVTSRAL